MQDPREHRSIGGGAGPAPLYPNNVTNNLIRLSRPPLCGIVQRSPKNAALLFNFSSAVASFFSIFAQSFS